MTERAIICARIAELKQMLADLQASLRRLEMKRRWQVCIAKLMRPNN
jgi:hypothetical protein